MKVRPLVIIVGFIAAIVAIYQLDYTYRYRYRLTIEVEVGGQVRAGSGVIQVTNRLDFIPGSGTRYTPMVKGEAVYVDLGSRGNLFALLGGPNYTSALIAEKTFTALASDQEQRLKAMSKLRAQAELGLDQLPTLLMFKDLNDPKSVSIVQSADLAAAFGPGVQFKRPTIQMTDDAVTTGINHRLTWPKNIPAAEHIDGKWWPESRTKLQTGYFVSGL